MPKNETFYYVLMFYTSKFSRYISVFIKIEKLKKFIFKSEDVSEVFLSKPIFLIVFYYHYKNLDERSS